MDDQFISFNGEKNNDFDEIRSTVRADHQPPVGVLAKVIDDHGVIDGVEDVVISNAVAAGRRVDLHWTYCTTKTLISKPIGTTPNRRYGTSEMR